MVRIKPAFDKPKKELVILMDERVDKLDDKMLRIVVAVVEVKQQNLQKDQFLVKMRQEIEENSCRKFHFTDLNISERKRLVKYLNGLDFECKTHVGYFLGISEEAAKEKAIKGAIQKTQKILSKTCALKFIVENSNGYENFIKHDFLTQDASLSIIADTMSYIIANRLDYAKDEEYYRRVSKEFGAETSEKAKLKQVWFNDLADHNRLESYFVYADKTIWLSREYKLAKIDILMLK